MVIASLDLDKAGKMVISTVFGGECIPASVHRIAQRCLRYVLVHVGAIKDREQPRKAPAIITQATNREDYILEPESGIFETAVDRGVKIKKGQIIG
jgi:predicted deacylase